MLPFILELLLKAVNKENPTEKQIYIDSLLQ